MNCLTHKGFIGKLIKIFSTCPQSASDLRGHIYWAEEAQQSINDEQTSEKSSSDTTQLKRSLSFSAAAVKRWCEELK